MSNQLVARMLLQQRLGRCSRGPSCPPPIKAPGAGVGMRGVGLLAVLTVGGPSPPPGRRKLRVSVAFRRLLPLCRLGLRLVADAKLVLSAEREGPWRGNARASQLELELVTKRCRVLVK